MLVNSHYEWKHGRYKLYSYGMSRIRTHFSSDGMTPLSKPTRYGDRHVICLLSIVHECKKVIFGRTRQVNLGSYETGYTHTRHTHPCSLTLPHVHEIAMNVRLTCTKTTYVSYICMYIKLLAAYRVHMVTKWQHQMENTGLIYAHCRQSKRRCTF